LTSSSVEVYKAGQKKAFDRPEEAPMARKFVDCREMPSESNCSLYISGEEDHLVEAAVQHAVSVHGHDDTPAFRDEIRNHMQDERAEVGVGAA
jgi:hypothetical protein